MFSPESRTISKNFELHIVELKELTTETTQLIDKHIVEICEGGSDSSLEQVKSSLLDFLKTKDERTRFGATAEFFVHLYLRQLSFKQEFLFFNLEERSIKKGFDGYFSKKGKEYLVESKSGAESTMKINHKSKLKESYDDISSVVAGTSAKSKNNPWKNAYNHASHADVGTSLSIRKKIKKLSDSFVEGNFKNIEEFNIIPCSTIFLSGNWKSEFSESIRSEKKDFFFQIKAKEVLAICLTKASYDAFIKYLESSK